MPRVPVSEKVRRLLAFLRDEGEIAECDGVPDCKNPQ